jgi:hypothetical protein
MASDIETNGRVSQYWKSQAEARAIVAEYGCKVCTWKYPGEIFSVSGDLWCHHCVREIGRELNDLEPELIPTP